MMRFSLGFLTAKWFRNSFRTYWDLSILDQTSNEDQRASLAPVCQNLCYLTVDER